MGLFMLLIDELVSSYVRSSPVDRYRGETVAVVPVAGAGLTCVHVRASRPRPCWGERAAGRRRAGPRAWVTVHAVARRQAGVRADARASAPTATSTSPRRRRRTRAAGPAQPRGRRRPAPGRRARPRDARGAAQPARRGRLRGRSGPARRPRRGAQPRVSSHRCTVSARIGTGDLTALASTALCLLGERAWRGGSCPPTRWPRRTLLRSSAATPQPSAKPPGLADLR